MEEPGYIVPPPGLIPPRSDPGADAAPPRPLIVPGRELPAFAAPAPAPSPQRPVWRLTLPGGRRLTVGGTVLLGRNPALPPGVARAELVAVDDPASTVSKTHAELDLAGDGLTVTDLHSTNGVRVAGVPAEPGVATVVPDGAELTLGDFRIVAERA
ncbi:FHA domain-containing protein [Leifsonia sp. AG29]|uniref:FHA domain-containing protein n=1 Tax=Leifsonia sp. AG29 TaxID=2598860 RepID=UPI00131C7B4D|nr:FHA domain-containing protein [Leifsonia sp. AG29]